MVSTRYTEPFFSRPQRQIMLTASAERVPVGHRLTLCWKVAGRGTNVANVQLTCLYGTNGSIQMIESIPTEGLRQMIFDRPDVYIFTLTAIYHDGSKCRKLIQVWVEE